MPERRSTTLSEAESKQFLSRYGIPVLDERLCLSADDAAAAAGEIGFPVVVKLCGERISHKTERGLVRLNQPDVAAVRAAAQELLAAATPADGAVGVLIAPMVKGARELIAGLHEDPQFGMTVMIGIGGVFTEVIADVSIRLAPIGRVDGGEMIDDLAAKAIFGEFRGEPAVDREALIDVLMGLSEAAVQDTTIVSVDLNPLIIVDGAPVAVDALVEVSPNAPEVQS